MKKLRGKINETPKPPSFHSGIEPQKIEPQKFEPQKSEGIIVMPAWKSGKMLGRRELRHVRRRVRIGAPVRRRGLRRRLRQRPLPPQRQDCRHDGETRDVRPPPRGAAGKDIQKGADEARASSSRGDTGQGARRQGARRHGAYSMPRRQSFGLGERHQLKIPDLFPHRRSEMPHWGHQARAQRRTLTMILMIPIATTATIIPASLQKKMTIYESHGLDNKQ